MSMRIAAGRSWARSGRIASTTSSRLCRGIDHGPTTGAQDAPGIVVVPVVDDSRQHVGVGAGRDGGEEVGGDAVRTIADRCVVQMSSGGGDRRLAIGEDPVQVRVGAQDGGEEDAPAAAHVDETAQTAEVIGGGDVVRLLLGPGGHRSLECRLAVGVPSEMVEEPLPVDMLEGGAALPHGVEQPGRGRRSTPRRGRAPPPAPTADTPPPG